MIEIKSLTFGYGNRKVFENLSANFTEGAIYGLLGENGVGKTTLLKLICSLQHDKNTKAGTITVDGHNPQKREPSFLQEIFYVPDEIPVPRSKVIDYVMENGKFYPNFNADRFREYAKTLEVNIEDRFTKMSFGQQKKAHLAYAFSLGTKYLLMDEPTNGLDIPSKAAFRSILAQYADEDRTIIISTHQVKDVENIIDPVIILAKEEVLLNATMQQITEKLYFDYSGVVDETAIYREANAAGMIQVSLNQTGAESKVNLEALFNAFHNNKELLKGIFSNR